MIYIIIIEKMTKQTNVFLLIFKLYKIALFILIENKGQGRLDVSILF